MLTETIQWDCGEMRITLEGADLGAGGVAILVHREMTGDGHFVSDRFERHKEFRSPGSYKLMVPPGLIAFEMHAPPDVLTRHANTRAFIEGEPLYYRYELGQLGIDRDLRPHTAAERAHIAAEIAKERRAQGTP